MAFFSGYIGTFVFALCVSVGAAVVVFVPLMIFTIPYALWVGVQNTNGRHKDKKNEKFFRSVRNAAKLYKAWITKTEPTF